MKRAVIYCRVSTEEQTKNLSLETQIKACRTYCELNGFEVYRVFVERGESAKTSERTEFKRLLSYCRENRGRVHAVVVFNLSRFARNQHDHFAVRALLQGYGVTLRSVNEPIDETSTGKLMEGVLAAFAQFDNDVRAERTVAGMKLALKKGRWPFRASLGYSKVPGHDGASTIVHDPERAPLIRHAFELCATGQYSKRHVLDVVTDLGLRTKKGKRLTMQSFHRMLTNPIYKGWLRVSGWGEPLPGDFDPIVEEAVYDRVQAVLLAKRVNSGQYRRNRPDFPLRRFVKCGYCGRPVTASYSKGRSKKYPYYHCPNRDCRGLNLRKRDLEEAFVRFLKRLEPDERYVRLLNEIVLDLWKEKQSHNKVQRAALERRLSDLGERKELLVNAFVYKQAIDQETYQEQIDRLREEITLAEMALHDAKLDEFDVESVLGFSEYVLLNVARLWTESTLEQRQRLQRAVFPDGVHFADGEFGTASTSAIFRVLEAAENEKCQMASPTGFEPVLPP